MNPAVCKKCLLKPCLTVHYTDDGTKDYHMLCLRHNHNNTFNVGEAKKVAVITQKAFAVIVHNLLTKYFEPSINPLDLDKLNGNEDLKKVEINRDCSYWLEHQIHDWN